MPPSASSKRPASTRRRAREGALLVAEELALDQRLGQRRAVHHDQRALARACCARGSRARAAPCPCPSRRAAARPSRRRHLRRLLEHLAKHAATADDMLEARLRSERLAQVLVLGLEPPAHAPHLVGALAQLAFELPAIDRTREELADDADVLDVRVRPGAVARSGRREERADPVTVDEQWDRDVGEHRHAKRRTRALAPPRAGSSSGKALEAKHFAAAQPLVVPGKAGTPPGWPSPQAGCPAAPASGSRRRCPRRAAARGSCCDPCPGTRSAARARDRFRRRPAPPTRWRSASRNRRAGARNRSELVHGCMLLRHHGPRLATSRDAAAKRVSRGDFTASAKLPSIAYAFQRSMRRWHGTGRWSIA